MDYICDICTWVYKEAQGVANQGVRAGTKWEDIPDNFLCPVCGVDKDQFTRNI